MPPATPTPRTLPAATAGSLAVDAATVEAFETLRGAGIDPLLLKGPALARLLYERGEERSWDDADLLVAPAQHRRAISVLGGIGFHPRINDPLERGSVPHAVHLLRPARSRGGTARESIDLHLSFAGVHAPAERFWRTLNADRDRIELFGRAIDVPSARARLALVALHAAAHGSPNQRSLRDLQRAVSRFGVPDWSVAATLAREWEALDFFVVGLGLDPEGVRLLGALGIAHQPSTAAAMRGMGMPRAQRSLEQLGRTRGAAGRLRLILRKVFPSPELMRIWKPIARRGPPGLVLAYLWRPPWLLFQLVPALRSYLEARRG